jgi:hypothetical protein
MLWIALATLALVLWTQVLGKPNPLSALFSLSFKSLMLYGILAGIALIVYGMFFANDSTSQLTPKSTETLEAHHER